MMTKRLIVLGLAAAIGASTASGCGNDKPSTTTGSGGRASGGGGGGVGGGAAGGRGGNASGGGGAGGGLATSLYERLGSEAGISTVMTNFVVNRVLKDAKINGYFLNSNVDGGNVIKCLTIQVSALTGSKTHTYPSMGCRDMVASHRGLKISMLDFTDLAGHLVDELKANSVAQSDIDVIVNALTPMATDIVEDPTNMSTVYHRVGRKPAIETVIANFITRVVADARINGFFGAANAARLKNCLVRQVCSIDGPCRYGSEVDGDAGVSASNVCKGMKSSHMGLTSPPGGAAGSRGITKADFDALVEDLIAELDAAGVSAGDKMAILSALGPTCNDIVAGGVGCSGNTVIGVTTANRLVMFDAKVPMAMSTPVTITGLTAGESIVGITLRPANGKLYGLGSMNRLYELNQSSGAATAIGTAAFAVALAGTQFGFDFNPTVDRIRVVSDQMQNLRLHPDMGTVVDGDAVTAGVQLDSPLSAPSISAVAYTNSAIPPMPTVTTLFGIDTATDSLVRQGGPDGTPSPNLGVITSIGALGVDTAAPVGFDILATGNVAYAVLQVGGVSNFYTVNLATGAATLVGPLGGGATVRAIAVMP